MNHFIVNPPIENDLDYYRFDEEIVQRVLEGESMLVIGLRRSGKTSFLYRLQRAAKAIDKPVEYIHIGDLFTTNNFAENIERAINQIKGNPEAIVLLDEAEVFIKVKQPLQSKLLDVCRRRTVVMTCAPVFVLESPKQTKKVKEFAENFRHHYLGPLIKEEVFALLFQSKRDQKPPENINEELIEKIWQRGERLPIILQALGAEYAEGIESAVSLAGVGSYILMGLTQKAKEALELAAYGESPDPTSYAVKLLTALGAFRKEKDSICIASQTLSDIIKISCPNGPKNRDGHDGPWKLHARILHISDLHFGDHCIDSHSIDQQLSRLISVIENKKILPDFIAVTGDLSWSGNRKELKATEDFLERLVTWYAKYRNYEDQEARQHFLIIPGNHEAAWSLTNGLSPVETEDWVCYSMAPFANFLNRFHHGKEFWDLERPFQIRCFENPSLAFVLISTSHFITKERKHGEFGDLVQKEVVKLLDQTNMEKPVFRIGLIHHNLRAFHTNGQTIGDGEGAMLKIARCKNTLDLILHGHVHQGEVDTFQPRGNTKEIPYSAVGSFGVRASHRPGDDTKGRVHNEFSVVDLETYGKKRRFTTQFYHLEYSPTADWEWKVGPKSEPKDLSAPRPAKAAKN